jgi:tetratricopeptide (TPR) repeat protein
MFESINNLIIELSNDPFNPELSTKLALEYDAIGQTASAVSFYLRTAEYGFYTHPEYVYGALLRACFCFEGQKNRTTTVLNLILKAIAYNPQRPEGWFVLAQYYERTKKWQESYTASQTGLVFSGDGYAPLPVEVGYPGEYGLVFQKAVAAWWVGRKDESLSLFNTLLTQEGIEPKYLSAVEANLAKLL